MHYVHYVLFGIICVVTLGFQFGSFFYLMRTARRHLNDVARCDPNSLDAPAGTTFPWLLWICHRLNEAGKRREVVTLQLALEEFEWSLAHDQCHLALQRVGIIAPIIGVFLTSLLFIFFQAPEGQELKPDRILAAVMPLVAGVLVGAILAIMNQFLLTGVGWQINKLRLAVRKWLDNRQDVRRDLMDAAAASALLKGSEEAVLCLHQAAQRFEMSADQHIQQSTSFQQAIRGIAEASVGFQQQIGNLARELRDLEVIATGTRRFVEEATKHGSAAFGRLEEVSSLLHSSAAAKLVPAMETQSRFAEGLQSFMENTGVLSCQLTEATAQLVTATQKHSDAWDRLDASWTAKVEPAHELFNVRILDLASKSEGLASTIASLGHSFDSMGNRIDELQPQWHRQVQLLNDGAQAMTRALDDGLLPALEAQQNACSAWTEVAQRLNTSTDKWNSATGLALSACEEHVAAAKAWTGLTETHIAPSLTTVASAVRGLSTGAAELKSSLETTAGAMTAAVTAFSDVPRQSRATLVNFETAVSHFSSIISSDFRQTAEQYAATALHTSEAVNSLRESSGSLAAATTDLRAAAVAATADIQQGLEGRRTVTLAVDETRLATTELRKTIEDTVAPTHSAALELLSSLKKSMNTLNAALEDRLVPSTDALQQVIPTLQQLQQTTHQLQGLAGMDSNLRHLVQTAQQLTMVLTAIEQLPDQIYKASQKNGNGSVLGRIFRRGH